MIFNLDTAVLVIVLGVVVVGAAVIGSLIGHERRRRAGSDHTPVGVVQGALLGLVGLLLAFGLSMAVGRYDARRSLVVQEANAIGTTYLRAQLLPEPQRTQSLQLLVAYTDVAYDMALRVPFTERFRADAVQLEAMQRDLWRLAGESVAADPDGTAPRLYIETLNETIDVHEERVASLRNRVPDPVMVLLVASSAITLAVLGAYLALLGRSVVTLIAATVLFLILYVSFDLDRPERGFIKVPATPLADTRASMDAPPAAGS